jgi:hypothetical protein
MQQEQREPLQNGRFAFAASRLFRLAATAISSCFDSAVVPSSLLGAISCLSSALSSKSRIMSDVNTQSAYRPDIDGLRALAVLSVFGAHENLPTSAR